MLVGYFKYFSPIGQAILLGIKGELGCMQDNSELGCMQDRLVLSHPCEPAMLVSEVIIK